MPGHAFLMAAILKLLGPCEVVATESMVGGLEQRLGHKCGSVGIHEVEWRGYSFIDVYDIEGKKRDALKGLLDKWHSKISVRYQNKIVRITEN